MRTQKRELYIVATVLTATLVGGAYFAYRHRAATRERVAAHSEAWPAGPRAALEVMMGRYGPPNAVGRDSVTWYERGPWKRISIRGDQPFNFIEHTVGYHVPAGAMTALEKFDHGLRFNRVDEEMTAASNSEALNMLALNLANEIALAQRVPDEASDFYVRTGRLAASGKSSPYLDRLMFEPYRPVPQIPWNREIGY